MGVRALRVRLNCDRPTLEHLWRTHLAFNDRLRVFLPTLFAMRRGELGDSKSRRDLYQRVARFVLARDAKDAVYLLNSVSIEGWKPATALKMKARLTDPDGAEQEVTGESWAHEAAEVSAKGDLAYDKDAVRDGLPDSLFQPVLRDAVAYIKGHDELVALWEVEHSDWLKKRAEWESRDEARRYLALRPKFEEFEQTAGGKAGKRRGRWHLYLTWLAANPDLAAWRGGAAVVSPLDATAKARIAKAKPWKQRSVEAEEFWRANPELAALDRLHGAYEREFIRRRKTKKNRDGFDHRPTFTQPHATLHPRWALFNAPQTAPEGYRELRLPAHPGDSGSVQLRLLTGAKTDGQWPSGWVTVSFLSDPRLACFVQRRETVAIGKGKQKGESKSVLVYRFIDRQLGGAERPAAISGAKLVFTGIRLNDDGSLKFATPYLVLACTIDDQPLTEATRAIQWSETGETTKAGKKRKTKRLPAGLVSCAVDLGIRNLGFATVAVTGAGEDTHDGVRVVRARNQWLGQEEARGSHAGRWAEGPDLAHIGQHKREIRRKRRQRGKPVKGENSHVELQDHIDHMGEDRFKKAARAIVSYALNVQGAANKATGEVYPRADVLIMEKLEGLIPDAERDRGINRSLVAWNRGQLVTRIKEVAADVGLKVFEIPPHGTSQVCSKCGGIGRRYSIVPGVDGRPAVRFGWVEKLFACPSCGYRANADHNASVNLHRKFVLGDSFIANPEDARVLWSKVRTERDARIAGIDAALVPQLERMHGLTPPLPETPF